MNVAALERFWAPSRRCDPGLIAGPDDNVVVWDLSSAGGPSPSFGDIVRVVPAWVTLPVPPRRRWRLLRVCAGMRGWRRTALVRVPDWVRRLAAHEIDEVVCFSAREFELAHWFAQETGRPCREVLACGTQYFGEFAFELLAVVPYAYWLHDQNRLEFTRSAPDTRCLYYFSPNHTEVPVTRDYVPITDYPVGEVGDRQFDKPAFPAVLDTTQWTPPPYREVYADDGRFSWPKPLVIVCNKASAELRDGDLVNCLSVDLLLALVGELTSRYTVVYARPRASDIVGDHAEIREFGDIEAVQRSFPEVITIQELHGEHSDLTFNELQLRLFATCERFVSVLGGSSYLASYFGGTNIVYAQAGWEVDCGAFDGWFGMFSRARVVAVGAPDELIRAVRREFLGDDTTDEASRTTT